MALVRPMRLRIRIGKAGMRISWRSSRERERKIVGVLVFGMVSGLLFGLVFGVDAPRCG